MVAAQQSGMHLPEMALYGPVYTTPVTLTGAGVLVGVGAVVGVGVVVGVG